MSWQPSANLSALEARSELLKKLRSFFDARGLHEVQTPLLSQNTVVDRYLEPVRVPVASVGVRPTPSNDHDERSYFLQTSPEFAMKRLLAAGMARIYQIGPAFRAGERGPHHNPEFTMVEWYCAGDNFQAGVQFLTDLVEAVTNRHAHVLTYQAAFEQFAGCDPHAISTTELASLASRELDVKSEWSEDRDELLNLLFAERVQPQLGQQAAHIVTHYPASQSALARIDENDPRVAERFELFIAGVELANGYHELLDADELARRNEMTNELRGRDGNRQLPAESFLLDAMRAGLPACSGCALGLDRLLMVLRQASAIDEVLAFPIERS